MKRTRFPTAALLAAALLLSVTIACQIFSTQPAPTASGGSGSVETTSPSIPPAASPTLEEASPTTPPQDTPTTPDSQPTPAPNQEATALLMGPCEEDVCISDGAFLLQRPIGAVGRNTIDVSSRFGEYQRTVKEAMHGVKFLNTTGIPVLAAADGVVVTAGDDLNISFGPGRNVYGNLVILRHDLPGLGQPVFTLYGQLSEISVNVDDQVSAGDEIGKVGNTGRVQGSTLSFEVRLGDNNYGVVCNPELWLSPLPYEGGALTGAIAGRIQDADGNLIHPVDLQFELLGGPGQPALDTYYLKTYSDKRLSEVSPWKENFAMADLPPGRYQISFFLKGFQQREVEVQPGKLTLVNFTIP